MTSVALYIKCLCRIPVELFLFEIAGILSALVSLIEVSSKRDGLEELGRRISGFFLLITRETNGGGFFCNVRHIIVHSLADRG